VGDEGRKKKKRRGDDPRLDALAEALAKESEEGGARRDARRDAGKDAPGVIVAGGLDVAKVHVAGLAPPQEKDHATLPMRKVVIGAIDTGREAGKEQARKSGASGRVIARWRTVSLAAAGMALVSLNAEITLTNCTLAAGQGGDGGAGGDAQGGGSGGVGGLGGSKVGTSKNGCAGGTGGEGGNGGPGGGGLGGPSLGIAFQGDPPKQQAETVVTPKMPGAGGPGGNTNAAVNSGEAGIAAEQLKFP
jgi:hypothetical protein